MRALPAGRASFPAGSPAPAPHLESLVVHPPRMSVEPNADGFRAVQSRRCWRRIAAPRCPVPANLVGKCFNCLSGNHVKAECTFPSRRFNCMDEGHQERDCPLLGRGEALLVKASAASRATVAATLCPVALRRRTPSPHAWRPRAERLLCHLFVTLQPRSIVTRRQRSRSPAWSGTSSLLTRPSMRLRAMVYPGQVPALGRAAPIWVAGPRLALRRRWVAPVSRTTREALPVHCLGGWRSHWHRQGRGPRAQDSSALACCGSAHPCPASGRGRAVTRATGLGHWHQAGGHPGHDATLPPRALRHQGGVRVRPADQT